MTNLTIHNPVSLVHVVSKPGCTYCDQAKAFLEEREAPFVYEVLDPTNEEDYQCRRNSLVKLTGATSFPFIFLNGTYLGGFQQLVHAHDTGRLAAAYREVGVTIRDLEF